jgi:hypothetical protein
MLKQPKLIPVKLRYKNNKLTQTLIESYKVLLLVIPDSGSRKLVTKCFSKNITTKLNALKKGEMFTFTLNNKNLTQVVVSRFSCKSRFCNSCGQKATEQWITQQGEILPDCQYRHLTFTMPDVFWEVFKLNRQLLNSLFCRGLGRKIGCCRVWW